MWGNFLCASHESHVLMDITPAKMEACDGIVQGEGAITLFYDLKTMGVKTSSNGLA